MEINLMQELGKMKKLAALFLSVLLFMGVLAGCSDKGNMTVDQAKAANPDYVGSTSNGEYEYDVYKTHIELTKYIGKNADVVIPEKIDNTKVTKILSKAFTDTKEKTVKKITIPATITDIDTHAFYCVMGLEEISADSKNAAFVSEDGVLYSKDKKDIIAYPIERGAETYEIPSTVTVLQNSRFAFCSKLKSIKIPDSVTKIGDYVFQSCSGLTEMTIPDSVTQMGSSVFLGCTNLKTLTLPKNLESGDETMVWNCPSLQIIKGYTGSPAQEIAKNTEGVKFVSLGVYEKPTEAETQPTTDASGTDTDDPYQDPAE